MRTPRRTPDAGAPALPAPAARGRRAHAGPPAEERPEDRTGPDPTRSGRAGGTAGGSPERPGGRPWPSLRPRTVRAKIISLLMVPVVSLLALWAFATVGTAHDVARLSRLQRADTEVRGPVAATVAELQAERIAAVRFLAAPGADREAALDAQGRRTDAAVAALRLGVRNTVADAGDYPVEVARRLRAFVAGAEALSVSRTDVTARRTTAAAALDLYSGAVDAAFTVQGALVGQRDGAQGADARVLLEFDRAAELLAREDALLAAHADGRLTPETVRRFAAAAAGRRALTDSAAPDLPAAQRARWRTAAGSAGYAGLVAAEDRVLGATGKQAVPAGWEAARRAVADAMRDTAASARTDRAADRTTPLVGGLVSGAGAAVLLGLAAVAASLVISVRIGRGLVVELVALRNGALEIAHHKLPHAMDRLRAGEEIDVAAETPAGPPAEDEVGQVGEALATVHRAALGAAVERAELANGVSGVFVNLARRSQVLVHRQLNLLDSMERRADDPNELGDLFRLDHLTTRMRRHAESLIILSGAAPGRAWRMPVPLTNVVRAAVSEIEDYPRVEVRGLPEAGVIGGAVADLTHLLAELIENAAQFSPPHTKVRVSGEPVGNGYVLEVEDRGLGMGPERLAEANRRIERSEALDLFDSDRLGLFVVSRLAARHHVRVHLRTSPYGGTTAVVLLPTALLQGALPAGSAERPRGAEERAEQAADLRIPVRGARPVPARAAGTDRAGITDRAGRADRVGTTDRASVADRAGITDRVGSDRAGVDLPGIDGSVPWSFPAQPRSSVPEPAPVGGGEPVRGHEPLRGGQPPASGAGSEPVRPPAEPGRTPRPGPAAPAGRGAESRPVAEDPPPAPVTALRQRVPAAPAPRTAAGTVTGLPRRVRQASLVPQLREVAPPEAAAGTRAPEDPSGLTPEQARDRMAAYRAGWARGADEATHAGTEGERS
ncbi:nitrate- and nitrite sensing domain-containing protein [Streptomyces sp. NRRL S-87]|uniref:sensor histidine kinase n=1 Tax=Streptomyces sp. NRRL S-87 TaxID=1463920 RepID=UPI0004C15931|nr:nitrate- and nitrite sensing domain-containing protein [Streptomyces sp. NRRL S-87]